MTKEQVINTFWNSFSVSAYDEGTVPDQKLMSYPYITYQVLLDNIGKSVNQSVSLWDRSTSWGTISALADQIRDRIGAGGIMLPCDDGGLWIRRGSPFMQRVSDPDDMIRRIYVNVNIEFITSK